MKDIHYTLSMLLKEVASACQGAARLGLRTLPGLLLTDA